MNKQSGPMHVTVVGILVVALLGALGFILWQNFIKKDEPATQVQTAKTDTNNEPAEVVAEPTTKLYETSKYSFEYPLEGWLFVEKRNDYDPANAVNPEVRTTDYSPAIGMGIDVGAKVGVYSFAHTSGVSLAQDKANMAQALGKLENLKDITLGGVPAYSYSSGYEGYRYTTKAIKDGTIYQIVYQYAGDDPSIHRGAYDMVVESFKFK